MAQVPTVHLQLQESGNRSDIGLRLPDGATGPWQSVWPDQRAGLEPAARRIEPTLDALATVFWTSQGPGGDNVRAFPFPQVTQKTGHGRTHSYY
jgi:hypothetical protein